MLRSVAPPCAGRMEMKCECAECTRGAKTRGNEISSVYDLWNSLVYMHICSISYKNEETRKEKERTIKRTKRESKMTLGTEERCKMEREAKGVMKLNTFGCLCNGVPSLHRLAQIRN